MSDEYKFKNSRNIDILPWLSISNLSMTEESRGSAGEFPSSSTVSDLAEDEGVGHRTKLLEEEFSSNNLIRSYGHRSNRIL